MGNEVQDDGYKETAINVYQNRKFRVRPPAGIQVSNKQNVTSSLTWKDLMLWGASVTEI